MKHAVLIFLLILTTGVQANDALLIELLGRDATFDAAAPTPAEVIGVNVGERHLYHHEIVRYLDALAAASPRMVSLGKYGETYGGRALMQDGVHPNVAGYQAWAPVLARHVERIREQTTASSSFSSLSSSQDGGQSSSSSSFNAFQ